MVHLALLTRAVVVVVAYGVATHLAQVVQGLLHYKFETHQT